MILISTEKVNISVILEHQFPFYGKIVLISRKIARKILLLWLKFNGFLSFVPMKKVNILYEPIILSTYTICIAYIRTYKL